MTTFPKTTKLGTAIKFETIDYRGRREFPTDARGIVYYHHEVRTIRCQYTGLPITRNRQYIIKNDSVTNGWRIDLVHGVLPPEAIYGVGPDKPETWKTPKDAAKALAEYLDHVALNTTI